MAKARKGASKKTAGTRKAATRTAKAGAAKKGAAKKGAKKSAAKKKTARRPAGIDLRPLKKQIRLHVEKLSAMRSTDPRVTEALARLRGAHREMESSCGDSMIIPFA